TSQTPPVSLYTSSPSKEAIVLALAADAFVAADDDFAKSRRAAASPEEDLFLLIATGLRRLKRHRTYLTPLVQVALSPLVPRDWSNDIGAIRGQHFQRVSEILTARGVPNPTPVDLQLYWTLYIGILSYWICDRSPKQEDSRVLIDQSISMFCDWLCRTPEGEAPSKPFPRSAAREQLTEKEQEEEPRHPQFLSCWPRR